MEDDFYTTLQAQFRTDLMIPYYFHIQGYFGQLLCHKSQGTLHRRSHSKICIRMFVQTRNLFKINLVSNRARMWNID